ncbi:MAG: hypothetical protein CMI13_11210 [Oleibacter sp.]|nr:hypothetical protein [Thalassolituus sp.]|tara:strand:- start:694 stop:888 length:195 start_codon:yes stop_codon:yes gene_type:complete
MEPSKQLQDAMQLLKQDPLPADAEDQLLALEEKAPKEEARMFADLWSALMAAGYQPEIPTYSES